MPAAAPADVSFISVLRTRLRLRGPCANCPRLPAGGASIDQRGVLNGSKYALAGLPVPRPRPILESGTMGYFLTAWHVVAAVLLALIVNAAVVRRRRTPLPPGPRGWPVIGNVFDMPASYHWKTFAMWGEQYGTSPTVAAIIRFPPPRRAHLHAVYSQGIS